MNHNQWKYFNFRSSLEKKHPFNEPYESGHRDRWPKLLVAHEKSKAGLLSFITIERVVRRLDKSKSALRNSWPK